MRLTLSNVAGAIAYYVAESLGSSKDDREIYAYGLQILLGAVIKLLVILALSWAFGSLHTTVVLVITYAALRWFGGGAHMSTYFKCLLAGTTIIVGLGKLSQVNLSTPVLTCFAVFTLIFALYVCWKWAPGGSEKKQIQDRQIRFRQKTKMTITILLWSIVIFYLIQHGLLSYVLAMILGCVSSVFFITPCGYWLFSVVDTLTERGGDHDESQTAEIGGEFAGHGPGVYCRNRSQA